MKNRYGSRLIALLLSLVMLFNIAPMTAFAAGNEGTDMPSAQKPSPDIEKEGGYSVISIPSAGTPPTSNESGFTVHYVVKGKYTYSGNNLLLKTVKDVSGQVSAYQGTAPDGCEFDNSEPSVWQVGNPSVLTVYVKPLTAKVHLRYLLIVEKDNRLIAQTFQAFQNKESGLAQGDLLEAKKFLLEKTGKEEDKIDLETYAEKPINQLAIPLYVPNHYLVFNNSVSSRNGVPYTLSYYGYNYGSEAGENLSVITRDKRVPWKYDDGQINLYFKLDPANMGEETYHTITWLNEDGTQIAQTLVKEGGMPSCPQTPTKASDENYSYTFNGWTPEVVPATADATYTAQFTQGEKQEGTIDVIYRVKNAPVEYIVPAAKKYEEKAVVTLPEKPNIAGYLFDGWKFNNTQIQSDTFTIPDYFNQYNPTVTITGDFTENKAQISVSTDGNGHVGSKENNYYYYKEIGVVTGPTPPEIVAKPNDSTQYQFDHWVVVVGDH